MRKAGHLRLDSQNIVEASSEKHKNWAQRQSSQHPPHLISTTCIGAQSMSPQLNRLDGMTSTHLIVSDGRGAGAC